MSGQWSPVRLTTEGRASARVAILLLMVYAAGTLYVGVHHEPWRDEADSWLVVRDAPITTIFRWTRNAGTPALWYVVLKPLVWLGFPYQSQEFFHLLLAWAAAAVFLMRSPFTWVTKLLALASYYFAYEYAVIARSYVLTILLSFLIAAWYPQRYSRPIRYAIAIALLFNANVHGAVIASILVLLFVMQRPERKPPWMAVTIMMSGAIAAWLQLRTAPDAAFPHVVRNINPFAAREALASAFFPGVSLTAGGFGAALLVGLIAASLRRQSDALLLLVLSMLSLNVLFVFVWFGGYRHAGLLLLSMLLAVWIARDVPRDTVSASAALLLNAALLISAVFSLRMAYADVKMDFSGSREMGEFIRDNHLDRYVIAAHDIRQSEAVLPWIPGKQLWYAALGHYGTYMQWNREEEIGIRMPYPIAIERAVQHFVPQGKAWLLLLNAEMPEPSARGFRLIYTNRGRVYRHPDERYWLYEWTGGP
jgi:hypothetical protein